jgi:glycosyltransferase involved in cell wall biosynthesis
MRILHVNLEHAFGGGENQVAFLMRHLRESGHESTLAAPLDGALAHRVRGEGFEVDELRAGIGHDPRAGWQLRALCARRRPEVVHFHTGRSLTLAPYRPRGLPAVTTRRMDYAPRGAEFYVRWLYAQVDAIVAVCGASRDALAERGIDPARVTVVPSGVAVDHFARADREQARAALGIDAERLVVAIVGSLHARKGHAVLLRALAALRGRGLEVLCLAAGEGPERAALQRQAEEAGIAANLRLLGHVPDVLPVLAAADLAVQPSLAEAFGGAAVEAMACGRAVVASGVGGWLETIGHEQEGQLVPVGDAEALSAAMERCLRDPALRRRLGEAGRRRAAAFSTRAMAEGNEAMYQRLLGERTAPKGRA